MKLLFWNLGRRDNKEIAKEAIVTTDVDIAVFAEYGKTDCNDIANKLGKKSRVYMLNLSFLRFYLIKNHIN